jgi:hypothetical protein
LARVKIGAWTFPLFELARIVIYADGGLSVALAIKTGRSIHLKELGKNAVKIEMEILLLESGGWEGDMQDMGLLSVDLLQLRRVT